MDCFEINYLFGCIFSVKSMVFILLKNATFRPSNTYSILLAQLRKKPKQRGRAMLAFMV
jgi:hypothetical protein